jgi:hypothetical protein
MRKSIKVIPKKRGRPATGKDPLFAFRMSEEMADQVDRWGREQSPPLSRSEAIRALIAVGLSGKISRRGGGGRHD